MRARGREQSARLTYFKVCYLSHGYLIVEELSNGYVIVEPLDFSVLSCL